MNTIVAQITSTSLIVICPMYFHFKYTIILFMYQLTTLNPFSLSSFFLSILASFFPSLLNSFLSCFQDECPASHCLSTMLFRRGWEMDRVLGCTQGKNGSGVGRDIKLLNSLMYLFIYRVDILYIFYFFYFLLCIFFFAFRLLPLSNRIMPSELMFLNIIKWIAGKKVEVRGSMMVGFYFLILIFL